MKLSTDTPVLAAPQTQAAAQVLRSRDVWTDIRAEGGPCNIKIARTRRRRTHAFQLVREALGSRKDATGRFEKYGRRWQEHLDAGRAVTFLADRAGSYIGTITVIFNTSAGLPADEIFPGRLDGLRQAGRNPCEIASLAVEAGMGKAGRGAVFELFRAAVAATLLAHGTDMVGTVMARHGAFYRRVLLFDEVSAESRVSPKTGAQVRFARLDIQRAPSRSRDAYGHREGQRDLNRFFFDPATLEPLMSWIEAQCPFLSGQSGRGPA